MGDFRPGGNRFGGRDAGRPNFFNKDRGGFKDRNRGPVTMHQTTCAKCGSSCEVPFRPVEGRPLYCNNCFQGKKTDGDSRGGDRFGQKNFSDRRPFSRPDFKGNTGGENNSEIKRQLETLNSKMDRLIRAAELMAGVKPEATQEPAKEAGAEAIKEQPAEFIPKSKVKKSKKKISQKGKRK